MQDAIRYRSLKWQALPCKGVVQLSVLTIDTKRVDFVDRNRTFAVAKTSDNGKGPAYSYTDGGRLNTRLWARGTNTAYGYTAAGDLGTVTYNDGVTPGVTNGYDRLGRKTNVVNGSMTTGLVYSDAGRLLMETKSGGVLNGMAVVNQYDTLLRRTNVTVYNGTSALATTGYGYDAASRLAMVSNITTLGTYSATYQ